MLAPGIKAHSIRFPCQREGVMQSAEDLLDWDPFDCRQLGWMSDVLIPFAD
jgi:hypothetical protein